MGSSHECLMKKKKTPLLERSFKMVDRRGLEPRTLGLRERIVSSRNVFLYIKKLVIADYILLFFAPL